MYPESWIVTNAHVVPDAIKVIASQASTHHVATLEYYDRITDLAILRVSGVMLLAASIRGSEQIEIGATVFAIGSPLGLENSISEGIVSARRSLRDVTIVQTTAPISPGSSGGGLFDSEGLLVAITTFKLTNGENLNFAVDASYIFLLKEALWVAGAIRNSVAKSITGSFKERIESNIFIEWLLQANDTDGTPLFLKARKILLDGRDRLEENNTKSFSETMNQQTLELQKVAQKFFASLNAIPEGRENVPTEPGNIAVLNCFIESRASNHRRYEFTITIDYRQHTSNGYPATISDDLILWKQGSEGQRFLVNRYNGSIVLSSSELGVLGDGRCDPAGPKRF